MLFDSFIFLSSLCHQCDLLSSNLSLLNASLRRCHHKLSYMDKISEYRTEKGLQTNDRWKKKKKQHSHTTEKIVVSHRTKETIIWHGKCERALASSRWCIIYQCGWIRTHSIPLVGIFFCKMKSAINGSIGFCRTFKQSQQHSSEIWVPKCWDLFSFFFRGVIKDMLQMNYVRNFSPQINWQMSK